MNKNHKRLLILTFSKKQKASNGNIEKERISFSLTKKKNREKKEDFRKKGAKQKHKKN